MTLFQMPYICSARVAQPLAREGTPFSYIAASWTFLVATVCEIFAVNFTMTRYTKGDAIINIKSKAGMFSPVFNMVSMYCPAIAALLADKIIPLVYSVTPFFKLWSKSGAVTLQRFAIFISTCFFAYINFTITFASTFFRASELIAVMCVIFIAANLTLFFNWWITISPAFFGAIMRGIRPICFYFVFRLTNCTYFENSFFTVGASIRQRTFDRTINLFSSIRVIFFATMGACIYSFQSCTHEMIIPHNQIIRSVYVAVCLERLAGMGLSPERVTNG